jgi:ribosomal-protein-alanine N-acetyltransferase
MINRNFASFPVLTTDRLTLRQLSPEDQHNIFALRSDPEINKYVDREPAKSIEDAINFIGKIRGNIENNNSLYWVITLTATNTFLGTICLFDFTSEKNSCEIGYELLTKFQKQGIMKEAAEKVTDYAFKTLQFQKIAAVSHKDNASSLKLLSKLKFILSNAAAYENPDYSLFELTDINA